MWKILMFEISAKNGFCDIISGSEEKTSDLATHFSAILTLQIRFCLLFKRSTNIQGWQNYPSPRWGGGGKGPPVVFRK